MLEKIKTLIGDVVAYWRVPATGDHVAYKEYLMLSVGWLGMRLATCFGIGFGVNDAFTAMTLHMTHRDLLICGYICTAIGYAMAPLNAYIIDNLRSRSGKYRVYVKLAPVAAALSLGALFFPYEKLGYLPMVLSLFFIGQIQGYIQGWYSTGVSNLVYVISPNSQERVKIMAVSSLIHNFAPSLTGFLIPVLSDKLAGGDLYNIKTYRMIYPVFIVIGVVMSAAAYFGVRERIVVPRSRVTGVSLPEALRAVSKNKLFWIKCSDNWNNFMEDSKNVLMQWLFYYGKVGSMTTYGVMDTLSYNSSMWAMLASPWLIDKLGKRGFKLVKNITQIFITLGLSLTYKKSLVLIFIFYFLNRFWETTEVIDRAMESDIRDYQQYISGERIDGSFGVIDTYVGGAVGAVTNLFIPWVYRRNGFDGTDYSVLSVYDSAGNYRPDNILYTLLDKLLLISLVGAAVDVLPWFFYDLTEADQKGVVRVVRIRSAVEDADAGLADDANYCEACEAVFAMREYLPRQRREKAKAQNKAEKKAVRAENKEIRRENEEISVAHFVHRELTRYETPFGTALLNAVGPVAAAAERQSVAGIDVQGLIRSLPKGGTKEEKTLRADAVHMLRTAEKESAKAPSGEPLTFSAAEYEALYDLPEDTPEQRAAKRAAIKQANKRRRDYAKRMKPYLWARRHVLLADAYRDVDGFTAGYDEAKQRVDRDRALQKAAAEKAAAARRAEAAARRKMKK